MVGARGFEPPTFCSQNYPATIADGVNASQPSEMITESNLVGVQPSHPVGENAKDFTTRLLPTSGSRHAGVQGPTLASDGCDWLATGTTPRIATTPTTADLYALQGGRDRILTVREAAKLLRVGTWAIYHLCEVGELPHIRIIDSIRIRPTDLAAFAASRRVKAWKK